MKKMDTSATGSWTLDNKPTSSTVKNSCHPNLKVLHCAENNNYTSQWEQCHLLEHS